MRTERWKYIQYTELSDMDELYDLESDPHEMKNLIGQSEAELRDPAGRIAAATGCCTLIAGRQTPITQWVGAAAVNAGFEAVLIRSAADSAGENLVVFFDNLHPGSRLAVVAPDPPVIT